MANDSQSDHLSVGTGADIANLNDDITRRLLRPSLTAPLRLQTHDTLEGDLDTPIALRHAISAPSNNSLDPSSTSPTAKRLPSFRQLSKIAAAGEEDPRPAPSYPPPPPSSSSQNAYRTTTMSHSPVAQQQSFPHVPHLSPANSHSYHPQTSPAGMQNDSYYATSPPSATFSAPGFYPNPSSRRPSMPYPAAPASLTSAASTESTGGRSIISSGAEGYSTSYTTPTDSANSSDSHRPSLPTLSNMPPPAINVPGAFTCEYPGCTAAPFQTQYLLNSHANVHSSNRPHYCPMSGCPRSEGGKGFKRKNEMIRHGLVHDSPGYMCPFCPDREHKYPRPDNLQRHVRVHHIDKDKDDPALRDVLSQRAEGTNRGRRRRTGP